jgi:hypothetical protein
MRTELFKLDLENLVEFSVSGADENYKICSSDSFFMEEQLFYLFQSCFEKSNKIFDYNEPTKYGPRNIIPLLNRLRDFQDKLASADSEDSYKDFILNRSMGGHYIKILDKENEDWLNAWKEHQEKLMQVCLGLITLAENCINEDKVLWVRGY